MMLLPISKQQGLNKENSTYLIDNEFMKAPLRDTSAALLTKVMLGVQHRILRTKSFWVHDLGACLPLLFGIPGFSTHVSRLLCLAHWIPWFQLS